MKKKVIASIFIILFLGCTYMTYNVIPKSSNTLKIAKKIIDNNLLAEQNISICYEYFGKPICIYDDYEVFNAGYKYSKILGLSDIMYYNICIKHDNGTIYEYWIEEDKSG